MLKLYYEVQIKRPDGTIRKRIKRRLSHSFTKQFLQIVEGTMMHRYATSEGGANVLDVGNTSRAVNMTNAAGVLYWAMQGAVSNAAYGIVVGTGTNAESVSDYKLQTQCAEGVGASQLQHSIGSCVPTIVVGSDVFFSILRTFLNASGSTITVTEIGIYLADYCGDAVVHYFCLARDKLAAGVDVDNAEIMTVQYTFKTTN